jgi:hypothetical protein
MSDQWTIERLPYRAEHGVKDVLRLRVPGGWLVVISFVNGSASTTFVPEYVVESC